MTLSCLLAGPTWSGPVDATAFRVCADPNNLPFSNSDGSGFENKLAQLIAQDLGQHVVYTWWAQRRGFIRNTLKAQTCDVVMGVPAKLDMVEVTRPYYRSTYVFVSRADRHYDLTSIQDPRLRNLSIGVQLIGDDGYNTPPAHALGEQGIIANLVGYTVYGDYRRSSPPARIVEAVAQGDVDVAAVWGPLAGYFAQRSDIPLRLTPISDTGAFQPLMFTFDIAIGVRKGDHARQQAIDAALARHQPEIRQLLEAYQVPLVGGDQTDEAK
ncbi:MAG: substrate-binding domain-containing protein [Xanthobacteraceae bacterium]|nr:substrate-binding domain-containing protein [Xanthobacteraceae bacterium]MBV9631086.1 substrate-binding domain-containing protein [Xanthobacteraceae bacterium]